MAASTRSKTYRIASLAILDVDDTEYSIPLDMGALTFSGGGVETLHSLTRGKFASTVGGTPDVYDGDDLPITGSFSARFGEITSSAHALLTDLHFDHSASYVGTTLVGRMGAAHPSRLWGLKYSLDSSVYGETGQYFLFRWCKITAFSFTEGKPSSLSLSFEDKERAPEVGSL